MLLLLVRKGMMGMIIESVRLGLDLALGLGLEGILFWFFAFEVMI